MQCELVVSLYSQRRNLKNKTYVLLEHLRQNIQYDYT